MEDTTLSGFGDILKAYRKQRKISQQELASRLDVHRNTIGGWERGDNLPESKTMVLELAKQLRLGENETRQLLEASLTAITPYWNVPYQRNPFFTGRDDLLHTLHEQLGTKQAVALCQSYALSGLGGIGKTQLALEYAYQYALDYRAIFWVAAETVDTLFSSFVTIAELIQLPEREEKDYQKMVKAVLRWFTMHDEWLLIFDNVEEVSTLKPFLPATRHGAILITTRLHALGGLAQAFELLPFSIEEGIRFLLCRSGLLGLNQSMEDLSSDQMKTAQTLVETMDGLPLALDQAGAYIDKTRCSLADYLQLYQSHQIHLLDECSESAEHPSSVVKTFLLSFERMAQTNAVAADMLRVCAFLAPDTIPEELFTLGAVHLGLTLSATATDAYAFNQAIAEALHYSLLQRNSQNRSLSLHRLLQVVLKATMDHTSYMQWATRIIETIAYLGSLIESEQIWSHYTRWFSHAQYVISLIEELNIVSLEATQVIYHVGRYLHDHAQYEQAEQYYLYCIHIREQSLGVDHPDLAFPLNSLGILYEQLGKYEKAELYYQRCLHIREQVLGVDHLLVAVPLNSLGLLYYHLGKYEQAEQYYLRCLYIRERELGSSHPLLRLPLGGLSLIYLQQAHYEQAEEFCNRALHIIERAFGKKHPEVAIPLNNLANVYYRKSDYVQAERLYSRALYIWEQAFGDTHPQVALALGNLGEVYYAQGKYEQSELLQRRCLSIREQVFELDHPDLAFPLNNLGNIYREQERYAEASLYYQRALTIREQKLGDHHPLTAETLRDFALLCHRQGAFKDAEISCNRAITIYEQMYGVMHPETRRTRASYAQLLRQVGKYDEAVLVENQNGDQLNTTLTKMI